MPINWFPGHMHKARKEIKKIIAKMDIILEILDARAPVATTNPLIESLSINLPKIKIINKADLADQASTQKWLNYFNSKKNTEAIATSAVTPAKTKLVLKKISQRPYNRCFNVKPLTAMILGIPNVGKSTIINTLAGKIIAKTGNEPAITRMQQRIKLPNNMLLVDTPGFLWPKLEDQTSALKLAALGSIKNTVFNDIDIAWFLVEFLTQNYPSALKNRYNITENFKETEEIINAIALKSGCIKTKSVVDLDKVAIKIINDFRNSKFGMITLDLPGEMQLQDETE